MFESKSEDKSHLTSIVYTISSSFCHTIHTVIMKRVRACIWASSLDRCVLLMHACGELVNMSLPYCCSFYECLVSLIFYHTKSVSYRTPMQGLITSKDSDEPPISLIFAYLVSPETLTAFAPQQVFTFNI